MRSRILLIVGLVLLLIAGVAAALAASSGNDTLTKTITAGGNTVTVTRVNAKPGQEFTTTVTRGGATRTITVPLTSPPLISTIRLPGSEKRVQGPTTTNVVTHQVPVPGPTRTSTVTNTTTVAGGVVTQTQTVPGPGQTVTRVETVNRVQTVTTPGPVSTVTVVETVTVKGNGNCPPKNPHCP